MMFTLATATPVILQTIKDNDLEEAFRDENIIDELNVWAHEIGVRDQFDTVVEGARK